MGSVSTSKVDFVTESLYSECREKGRGRLTKLSSVSMGGVGNSVWMLMVMTPEGSTLMCERIRWSGCGTPAEVTMSIVTSTGFLGGASWLWGVVLIQILVLTKGC